MGTAVTAAARKMKGRRHEFDGYETPFSSLSSKLFFWGEGGRVGCWWAVFCFLFSNLNDHLHKFGCSEDETSDLGLD